MTFPGFAFLVIFYPFGLIKAPFGEYFFIFSRVLKQIEVFSKLLIMQIKGLLI